MPGTGQISTAGHVNGKSDSHRYLGKPLSDCKGSAVRWFFSLLRNGPSWQAVTFSGKHKEQLSNRRPFKHWCWACVALLSLDKGDILPLAGLSEALGLQGTQHPVTGLGGKPTSSVEEIPRIANISKLPWPRITTIRGGEESARNKYWLNPWVRHAEKCSVHFLLCPPTAQFHRHDAHAFQRTLRPPSMAHPLGCLIPSINARPGKITLFKYDFDDIGPLLPLHHKRSLELESL